MKKPVVIKLCSLDYDYSSGCVKSDLFDYDDNLECALCGAIIYASMNNIYITHCPHCNAKWIKEICRMRLCMTGVSL